MRKKTEKQEKKTPASKKPETEAELKKRYLEELSHRLGCSYAACKRAGVSRDDVEQWLQNDEEFARQVGYISENALDYVEAKLFEGVNSGNAQLIKFYLENKGRSRGYGKNGGDKSKSKPDVITLTQDEMDY